MGEAVERALRVVLSAEDAGRIVAALEERDVSRGGVWNAGAGLWQRYDRPWDGPRGTRGAAKLVGSVGVTSDAPRRGQVTVYRVTLTREGRLSAWTPERLCDDALSYAGRSLASYDADAPPVPAQRSLLHADVRDVLRMDVRDLFRARG